MSSTTRTALCGAAWLLLSEPVLASVYFSEYVEGSSNNKAVEIVNTGSAAVDLSTYKVLLYFNGATTAGQTIALSGSLAAGDAYVVANSSASFAGTANLSTGSLTFNGDDAVALVDGATVLDVIGQIGVDPGSYWGSGANKTQDATLRRNDSVSSGDSDGSNAFDPASEWTAYAIDSFDGLGCSGQGGCSTEPPTVVRIYDIQGATHVSPLNGQSVTTRGIVTALRTVSGPGFYLQDPDGDGNPDTSDAIFIYTGSVPTVTVGQEVQVSGTVSEYRAGGSSSTNLSITQMGSPVISVPTDTLFTNTTVSPTVLGEGGRSIPTQVIDDDTSGSVEVAAQTTYDPANDGIDFMESLEGMLVQVNDARAVSPSNQYGEVWVVADNGANATGLNSRGGITLTETDGVADFNPERLQFDDLLFGNAMPSVNVGDSAQVLTGVVSYDFGNFEILPSNPPSFSDNGLQREVADVTRGADRLSIANYNVENLDPNDNDVNTSASGCPDADVADGKFDAIADQIVHHLNAPDIVALQEVQDNSGCTDDGVVASDVTLSTLVAAIVAAGGPEYATAVIDPVNDADGGLPGGNIRVAYLYDASRVGLLEGTQGAGGSTDATAPTLDADGLLALTLSPGRVDPNNAAWVSTRKPLAAVFAFNGHRIVTVNNHWSSKGGGDPLYGRYQPPANGSVDAREAQAQVVNDFVDEVLAVDPQAKVVVLGDLNEFSSEAPLDIVKGDPAVLVDLADELLPAEERYSYNYEGNSESLDHLLATPALFAADAEVDVVHINAEFADQLSDHDPDVASFNLPEEVCDGGTLAFSTNRYLAFEDQQQVAISVTRSGAGCGAASVALNSADGSATAGQDYVAVNGTLHWANGETGTKTLNVTLIDDSQGESLEWLTLSLGDALGATLTQPTSAQLRIRDDDRSLRGGVGPGR